MRRKRMARMRHPNGVSRAKRRIRRRGWSVRMGNIVEITWTAWIDITLRYQR
jgi:hypothetical protein